MEFSRFIESVSKVKKIPLGGENEQLKMAPNFRANELRQIDIEKREPMNAGVMALFYPDKLNETKIILILRKSYKGVHSAQVGFPGGREENSDATLKETALRETYEEVGVRPSDVEVIRKLTKLYIPPSNFWVHPYLGFAKHTPNFRRQESEVEELLEVNLEDFMDDNNLTTQTLSTSYAKNVDVPAFLLNQKVVWGATAMMLNEVKSLLAKVL